MLLLTKEKIEAELKQLWDNVMAIQDDELKEFAGNRIAAKEKTLNDKLEAQKELLKYLDKFAYEIMEQLNELLKDVDIKRLLIAKFGKDKEAVNTILFVFSTITKLLKDAV